MKGCHTLVLPAFFSYMRYSVSRASSLSLPVVSSSVTACRAARCFRASHVWCGRSGTGLFGWNRVSPQGMGSRGHLIL